MDLAIFNSTLFFIVWGVSAVRAFLFASMVGRPPDFGTTLLTCLIDVSLVGIIGLLSTVGVPPIVSGSLLLGFALLNTVSEYLLGRTFSPAALLFYQREWRRLSIFATRRRILLGCGACFGIILVLFFLSDLSIEPYPLRDSLLVAGGLLTFRICPAAGQASVMRHLIEAISTLFSAPVIHPTRFNLEKLRENLRGTASPSCLVLIVVESLSAIDSERIGGIRNQLPFLDKKAEDGRLYTNYVANSTSTMAALFSICAGRPLPPLLHVTPSPNALLNLFREEGWETSYMGASPLSFNRKDVHLSALGFGEILGQSEMGFDERLGTGIFRSPPDHLLFERALYAIKEREARNGNYLLVIKTGSSHAPWTSPSNEPTTEAAVWRYVDESLYQFLQQLPASVYQRGNVCVVGDHRKFSTLSPGERALWGETALFRVPLVIWGKGVKPGVTDKLLSHAELLAEVFTSHEKTPPFPVYCFPSPFGLLERVRRSGLEVTRSTLTGTLQSRRIIYFEDSIENMRGKRGGRGSLSSFRLRVTRFFWKLGERSFFPIKPVLHAVGLGLADGEVRNKLSEEYHNSRFDLFAPTSETHDVERKVIPYLPSGERGALLDLFCGQGREALIFESMGYSVTGVDNDIRMCAAAQKHCSGKDITILCADVWTCVPERSYEVIYMSPAMYSYITPRSRRLELLKKLRPALGPQGVLVISVRMRTVRSLPRFVFHAIGATLVSFISGSDTEINLGDRMANEQIFHWFSLRELGHEASRAGYSLKPLFYSSERYLHFFALVPVVCDVAGEYRVGH